MDSPFSHIQTVLSIGPGQLGIERGIESTGTRLRVAAYVEIETFVIANLIGLMEKGLVAPAPIWADIKTFRPGRFRNKLHGIIAGYPCQPFSLAGNRKGTDDPRHLWPFIERTIKSARPLWCFFENVEGHLSLGFTEVYQSLRRMGYLVEAGIYSAREVGAPHRRKRLFILAHSSEPRFWRQYESGVQSKVEREGELGHPKSEQKRRAGIQIHHGHLEDRGSGTELADTSKPGLQRRKEQSDGQERSTAQRSSGDELPNPSRINGQQIWEGQAPEGLGNNGTIWPAPPGPDQHPWEHPRTIAKSSMGCTIDGYNFREDLLRMFGNGVVHQTAAKAWKDLWRKHYQNKRSQ